MKPTLPLDVLLHIIGLLAATAEYHTSSIRSLQILSQTCKFMVPLCCKHLFSFLSLTSDSSLRRFGALLSKNPDIACYVRSLIYTVQNPSSVHELNILYLIRERSSLIRSIKLSSERSLNWNSFPESIRLSLVSLIQLPTVTDFDITNFKGFPATAFSSCSNLIHLRLGKLYLDPSEVNQVISRSKIPTPVSLCIRSGISGLIALLNSASLHAVRPIVDFSRLQKADFTVESRGDIRMVYTLIMATRWLEYIGIRSEWTDVIAYHSKFFDRGYL